jgi:hypothetical protein
MRAVIILSLLLATPFSAYGLSTDFEDLALGARFAIGETIHSNELAFDVVDAGDTPLMFPREIRVIGGTGSSTYASGRFLGFDNDLGLRFQLPVGTQHIAFSYYIADSSAGLIVNRDPSPLTDGFSTIDGSTIGGISVDVAALPRRPGGSEEGRIFLHGPIDSFTLRGTELQIDNVVVTIPEPSTLALLLITVAIWRPQRRRRRPC